MVCASSAEPEKLIRFAEAMTEEDHRLQSTSRQLRGTLEHFERRCKEPGMRVSATHIADGVRGYGDQCEPTDGWVCDVGRRFSEADRRWGTSVVQSLRETLARGWTAARAAVSDAIDRVSGFTTLIDDVPLWLYQGVSSALWSFGNNIDKIPDMVKVSEFLTRYLAENAGITDADFSVPDVLLCLFSKSPFCSDDLRGKLEIVDDVKSGYDLVFKFSEAGFAFFMAGILAQPDKYIDPWLDPVNKMSLFPNKPVSTGQGVTNLHGQDMSEVPRWMQILFGRREQAHSSGDRYGSVLGVSEVYAAEAKRDSADAQRPDVDSMPLTQRWQQLAQVQSEIATLDQELLGLQALGAGEHLVSNELEQYGIALQQRREQLHSQVGDWRNRVRLSDQGFRRGFDDGILDAPWRTRSDDFEDEVERLSTEIATVKAQLAHQQEFERVRAQLQISEQRRVELETSLTDHWWNDVPVESQRQLTYEGRGTSYGCTPTATSMVLDYWHSQDPNNKSMIAQELLDVNVEQGEFTATGMSTTRIHDEVMNLGYGVAQDYMGSDFETLRREVEQGPVVAVVKLGMAASGDNHAVVVKGISPDGSMVSVNDPWTGQSHTYSRTQFTQSWRADFGPDVPKNNFTVIRPS